MPKTDLNVRDLSNLVCINARSFLELLKWPDLIDGVLGEMRRGFALEDGTLRIHPAILLGEPGAGKVTNVWAMLEGLRGLAEIACVVVAHKASQIFAVYLVHISTAKQCER